MFLLQTNCAPYYKLLLLNRLSRTDLSDTVSSETQFAEKDNFVAYDTIAKDGQPVRRVFYFSIKEEKDQFIDLANQCIGRLQNNTERNQIREALVKIVNDDKFLDYFIQVLKQKKASFNL